MRTNLLARGGLAVVYGGIMRLPADVDAAAKSWGDFWRDSEPDGCTLAFPAEARDRIALGWRRAFADAGAAGSVLDIACGKGAVLRHAEAAGFAPLMGVDLAPPVCLIGSSYDVQGGVDARALPFPDRRFAVVVSQFGLEYAGLADAIAEAARVCDSAMMLLVHAADGVVVAQAREQLSQIAWLDQVGAVPRMRAVERGDVERLAAQVVERASGADNVSLLEAVYRTATGLSADPNPVASLDMIEQGMRGHAARMRELVAAAPTAHDAQAAADSLRDEGFVVDIRPEGGDASPLIGRWIIAHRARSKE